MEKDSETQLHTISLFVGAILDDMSNVSRSTTKAHMIAYMEAWRTELKTIQHIININGII